MELYECKCSLGKIAIHTQIGYIVKLDDCAKMEQCEPAMWK